MRGQAQEKGCAMSMLKNVLMNESGATAIKYGLIAAGIPLRSSPWSGARLDAQRYVHPGSIF